MKRIAILLSLMLLVSFSLASGQSIDLGTPVDKTFDGGTKIGYDKDLTFDFYFNNSSGVSCLGSTNGLCMYISDAAGGQGAGTVGGTFEPMWWDSVYAGWQYTYLNPPGMWVTGSAGHYDQVFSVNPFSIDGAGADTVGFGGAAGYLDGFASGYNEVIMTLHTNVGAGEDGKFLCIDSCWYPTSGTWLWDPQGNPGWAGPFCWQIGMFPDEPPVITPATVTATTSHCDPFTTAFTADDPDNPNTGITFAVGSNSGGGTAVVSGSGENGSLTYTPVFADVNTTVVVEVVPSSNGIDGDPLVVSIDVTNVAPVFTNCPGSNFVVGATNVFEYTLEGSAVDCGTFTFALTGVTPAPVGTYGLVGGDFTFNTHADDAEGIFTFTFEITDGDLTNTCDVTVEVVALSSMVIAIEKDHGTAENDFLGVIQGTHVDIDVTLYNNTEYVLGFDFLIAYDATALGSPTPEVGGIYAACEWEYFTYRQGATGNCGNACPNGLVRVVGMAETNNGPIHPVEDCVFNGTLFTMDFLVTDDRTFECMYVPIRFYWTDCGDNSVAFKKSVPDLGENPETVYQGIASQVWYFEALEEVLLGSIDPGDPMNIYDGAAGFPTYQGPHADCFLGIDGKAAPEEIILVNGGVDIICGGDIDGRGDINLNNIDNEIADAVLFANYFVYGLGVFTENVDGQIAATDVNADGLTLSVADLVYLVRIIVGDAIPYSDGQSNAKIGSTTTAYTVDNGIVSVGSETGAALIVVKGDVTPTNLTDNMTMLTNSNGIETRILFWNDKAESFIGNFLQVDGEIISTEFATADGQVAKGVNMPSSFELIGSYPNPFNPVATISFALPVSSDYSLVIYNVTGQKVADLSGSADAGFQTVEWNASNQASGIYFYKLSADNFSDTKKMVLLK